MTTYYERRLSYLHARRQRWLERLAKAEGVRGQAKERGQVKVNLRLVDDLIAALEKERSMKNPHEEYTAPTSHPPDWRLRANVTLNVDGKQYARGSEVPESVLDSLNGPRLLERGYLKYAPASSGPTPRPATPPPPPASAPRPVDPIAYCRSEVRRLAKERGCPTRAAIDLVDRNVLDRAMIAIAHTPRRVKTGGWGTGGGNLQQSGAGTLHRITDDAYVILCDGDEAPGAAA